MDVDDQTDTGLDDVLQDNGPVSDRKQHDVSEASEISFSASKTMSELKDLLSEPSKRFRSSSGDFCRLIWVWIQIVQLFLPILELDL